MATSVPHALTLTEVFNSFNATERAAFNTWPLANAFCHAVMTRNLDAVVALASFAKAANINIIGNADANAIIALAQSQDSIADPVLSGNWTARVTAVEQNGLNTVPTVVFTHIDGRTYTDQPIANDIDAVRLAAWVNKVLAMLDARDAKSSTIKVGVIG